MINAIELMVTDHKAHLIPPLHHDHVVAAVVGGSVLDLHGGSLLDPLLSRLVWHEVLEVWLTGQGRRLVVWEEK